jgi:ribosomal protein S8
MGSNPMFPIIQYNYAYNYLINSININYASKNLSFSITFSKKLIPILKIFKKINFIHRYYLIKIKNTYLIKIHPFYFKNLKIFKQFKLISTPTKTYYISLKALCLLSKKSGNSIYFISTTKGIITHTTAIKLKLSGFLFGFLHS